MHYCHDAKMLHDRTTKMRTKKKHVNTVTAYYRAYYKKRIPGAGIGGALPAGSENTRTLRHQRPILKEDRFQNET